jgi:hypothetical protein
LAQARLHLVDEFLSGGSADGRPVVRLQCCKRSKSLQIGFGHECQWVLEDVELARLGTLARVLPVAVKMLVAVQLTRPEVGAARSRRREQV